jgi:glycosyltransferase involved in cell wall biosynthesis
VKLVVFATYGSGLGSWERDGILERELALYEVHARRGVSVSFLSYGERSDLEIAGRFGFLTTLCNERELHPRLYAALAPWLHGAALRSADLYKTNQMFGADIARRAAALWRKPLIVRQGYGHYEHRVEEHGAQSREARRALAYERRNLRAAAAAVFTTPVVAGRAVDRYGLGNVHVIPNYVEPDAWSPPFEPAERVAAPPHLVFYGRFTEQKNLECLIDAASGGVARLTLIGDGPLREALRRRADEANVAVAFPGRLEQKELPARLRHADAFVLPSHYEGHPKALIEMMAFGMPILAADSPGIREQLVAGETALLATPTLEGLRAGIARLAGLSAERRRALGAAAREVALASYSIESVAQRERTLFEQILRGGAAALG